MEIINKYQPSILADTNVISNAVSPPTDRDSKKILGYKEDSSKLFRSLKGFNLFISWTVSEEISLGNPANVARRKNLVDGIKVLNFASEIKELADDFMKEKIFKAKAENDALILAAACIYGINYLVTCNMKDLANDKKKKEMIRVIKKHGYRPPIICTPGDFLRNYMNEPANVREESTNYFDKSQDLSYNVDTMKTIEHKEETIVEECRRIRNQLDEEYAKDPEKYIANIYKKIEEMKAQGVEFITKPFPPPPKRAMALLEKHRKELDEKYRKEAEEALLAK
ncbi:MAG: PIN domain-containing protein [Candidatus Portiera sp.]|nr:PIN domain-containing protein [Portiera sp.]